MVPGIYFGTYDFGPVRPYVCTSVRPSGIYFLTARRIFLLFFNGFVLGRRKNVQSPIFEFFVFCTCKGAKTPVFCALFQICEILLFLYFILLNVPDIFVFCSETVASNLHPENEQKHLFLCTFSAHLRAQAEWADKIFWNLDTIFFSMWQLFLFFGPSR